MDFYELRCQAGILNADAAKLFDTSLPTISRWNKQNSPKHVLNHLKMMTGLHPDWQSIKILPGKIITPTGHCITQKDIINLEYRENLLNQIITLAQAQNTQLSRFVYHNRSSNDKLITNIYDTAINTV